MSAGRGEDADRLVSRSRQVGVVVGEGGINLNNSEESRILYYQTTFALALYLSRVKCKEDSSVHRQAEVDCSEVLVAACLRLKEMDCSVHSEGVPSKLSLQ